MHYCPITADLFLKNTSSPEWLKGSNTSYKNKYLDTTITYNHLSSLSFIAFLLPYFNSPLSIELNFKNHLNASCAYYADKIKNCNNSRSFANTFNIIFSFVLLPCVASCPLAKLSFPFHLIHFSFNFCCLCNKQCVQKW